MPSSQPLTILRDIKRNVELARAFIENMTFPEFQGDQKTIYAVVRCLEIISEASRRLPEVLKERHRHIPWTQIASAGNVYRHGYNAVRDDFLWNTVKGELEPLRIVVDEELARLKHQ